MTGFVLRRLAASLLLLLLVLTVTFFLLHLAPGDPAELLVDSRSPASTRDELRRIWGLDQPLAQQYLRWLQAVALRGDWGISFRHQEPAMTVLARAFPNTVVLALAALAVAFGAGVPLGVVAARRRGRPSDHLIRLGSLFLYSMPVFWLGLMAILLFSHFWPVLPAGHMLSVGAEELSPAARFLDLLWHLALPALVLGGGLAAGIARFVRNSLLDILEQDYLRTARAKGLGERRVIWVHGLRNALVPVIQIFGVTLPMLLNGSLVTEVVFSWPGLGRTIFTAILSRDYPVVLASTAFSGVLVVLGNLLADLLHAAADPRLRHG